MLVPVLLRYTEGACYGFDKLQGTPLSSRQRKGHRARGSDGFRNRIISGHACNVAAQRTVRSKLRRSNRGEAFVLGGCPLLAKCFPEAVNANPPNPSSDEKKGAMALETLLPLVQLATTGLVTDY